MKKLIILTGILLLLVFSVSATCRTDIPTEDCPPGDGDFRTIGFWKHQFAVHFLGQGHAQIAEQELLDMLGEINKPPLYDGANINITTGYYMLWLQQATMQQRAQQQCFATLLNYASGAVSWWDMVDTDYDGEPDMYFIEAMNLFLYGDDYENNKNICDSINNMNE